MKIEVYNNQSEVDFSDVVLQKFERLGNAVLPLAIGFKANDGGVIDSLDAIEISIVSDEVIDQVHRDFMEIEGATDVITFAHGEIVISAEYAQSLAKEFSHSTEKELFLYIIHGLLHLAGHEDHEEEQKSTMEAIQFQLLEQFWEEG